MANLKLNEMIENWKIHLLIIEKESFEKLFGNFLTCRFINFYIMVI